MSSKGIDYSKWDHIDSDVESEEEDPQDDDAQNVAAPHMAKKSVPTTTSKDDEPFDLKSFLEGFSVDQIHTISNKDIFSASALLDMVVPKGLAQRAALGLNQEEDPVHHHLWDLTMKVRDHASHAQELLEHRVLDRLLSVIRACNLSQYNQSTALFMHSASLQQTAEVLFRASAHSKAEQAERLATSIKDTYFVVSVIHELCRYRSGCVAVAEHKSVVFELLSLPMDDVTTTSSVYAAYLAINAPEEEKVSPLELTSTYHPGMIEQSILDTMGRLVNGLDQHPTLRNKVCAQITSQIESLEKKMKVTEFLLLTMQAVPSVGHCINLQHTLKKLRKLVSRDPDETTKAWCSTFRIERHHLPLKMEPKKPVQEEAGECSVCGKQAFPLQRCSRW